MKNTKLAFLLLFFTGCYTVQAQFNFPSQQKTDEGKPLYEMEFSPRLKLNGYSNLGGNDMNSQSINLNSADPYNPIDQKNSSFNMYQSQLAFKTTYNGFSKGPLVVYVEAQWWGGPGAGGNLQLRSAYVDYNHWRIGQDWTFFGNGVSSWFNTLDWEGPNSGTWSRHIQVKYYNDFGADKSWKFEGGIESSSEYLKIAGGVTPGQFSVDPIVAFTKKLHDQTGYLRLAVMGRPIRYKKDIDDNATKMGWGVNANYKTMLNKKSYFMAQAIAGSGIGGSYTLSGELFGNGGAGNMYDAIYDQNGNFKTVPIYGGSVGVEHYFGEKKRLHSNLVLGYTTMTYNATPTSLVNSKVVNDNLNSDFVNNNSDSNTRIALPSATINCMYDVTKNFLIGFEYNIGAKQIINTNTQSSTVNRIAVGMMVGF